MPNFSIALTGLQADTVALNTIGNNLANLNTTAFKKQTTTFEDLFYQNIGTNGAKEALQVGVGTRVSGTTSDFSQGSLTTTNIATDMAVNGNGFFLVARGQSQALTRAGNFQLDAFGNLKTTEGESVLGYGAQDGVVNESGGLTALHLPIGTSEAAQATTNISLTSTLDVNAPAGTKFSTPVPIVDSLGQTHNSTVTYTKTGASTWDYSFNLPPGDATGTPANNTGTLTFDSTGKLVTPAANVSGITFPGLVDGASDLSFNFNVYDKTGAAQITQSAGASTTTASSQDGFSAGSYKNFTVDSDGVIAAEYSNGHTTVVGQVAVALVSNPQGLTRAGGNDYVVTQASGDLVAGAANIGGRGAVEDDSLEASNVDISAEFSDLIVAQRAFEANSKTVTTFDQVTQAAISLIR